MVEDLRVLPGGGFEDFADEGEGVGEGCCDVVREEFVGGEVEVLEDDGVTSWEEVVGLVQGDGTEA